MTPIRTNLGLLTAAFLLLALARALPADDWPMLGRNATRNSVSSEKSPPVSWHVEQKNKAGMVTEPAVNIKWTGKLGWQTFATPTVAQGMVWIGTSEPEEGKSYGTSVLRCFAESDGKLLYEYRSDHPGNRVNDTVFGGISCSPLIEGDRLWFTTNRCEVICLDIAPLKLGEGEPRQIWKLDMRKELGVFPRAMMMGPGRTCSISGSHDGLIYVVTGNGVDGDYQTIPAPEAPGLICLRDATGEVVWSDHSSSKNVILGEFSSPLVVEIDGLVQVIVGQGDGWLRSFEGKTGKLIWKFDMNSKTAKYVSGQGGTRNLILATPVYYADRIYVATGNYVEYGEGIARLVCIDPAKVGDISSELAVDADGHPLEQRRFQAVNEENGEKAVANPNSGLVWEYTQQDRDGDGEIGFEEAFQRTLGSVVIKDDLLLVGSFSGLVYCLDAKTGKVHWAHDCLAAIWASPLIVDDKAYVVDEYGAVTIFNLAAEPAALRDVPDGKFEPLAVVEMGESIYSAPVFANGVLYIATKNDLFAIQAVPQPDGRAEVSPPTQWTVEQRDLKEGGSIQASRGIRWSASLGSSTFSSPVVSDGLVWIGTNSFRSGANSDFDLHSVLKCFRVADGKQVYEYDSPKLGPRVHDAGWAGLGSSPLIEGDRLWLATNRSEVLCLDIGPLIRGEGTPRELWKLDLIKSFDIFPHVPLMGPPRPCSIGPSWNGRIFVTTNNGIDDRRLEVPKPDAPSLVCLNKDTGELIWKDSSPGTHILLAQMASPSVAEIQGQVQVIVPQSDGWVRAFDPLTGEKLWEFDVNAKTAIWNWGRGNRNSLLGSAVVYEQRVYLASGQDAEHGEGPGRLVCIDPTRRGDVSSELAVDANDKPLPRRRLQAVDLKAGEKAIPNPNSALVWEFVNCGQGVEDVMHRTMGSVAIAKNLVIVADAAGLVHCFDAKTGRRHWRHDLFAAVWASPLIVEDKIYVGDEDGELAVFQLDADPRHAEPIAKVPHPNGIYASPSYADDTLFVPTRDTLFAVDAHQQPANAVLPAPSLVEKSSPPKADSMPRSVGERVPNAIFVPTPHDVIMEMLTVAKVGKDDVVYDLGSGDGRIVIEAARQFQCRAVGLELDRDLVNLSRQRVAEAKLTELVTITEADLFEADFGEATVVAVYLYPGLLKRLVPKFEAIKPGTRIVSHQFEIPDFPAKARFIVESQETGAKHTVYLWTTPLQK